jgi:hypothetical protein
MTDKQRTSFNLKEVDLRVRRIWAELDGQNLAEVVAKESRRRGAKFKSGSPDMPQ